MRRLRSGQWLALTAGGLVVAALVGVAVCLVALSRLSDARTRLVDQVDPARVLAQEYFTALVNQETGIRGYAAGGTKDFLAPYTSGSRDATAARRRLDAIAASGVIAGLQQDLNTMGLASTSWHLLYADPVVLTVADAGTRSEDVPTLEQGRRLFGTVRTSFEHLQARLARQRAEARADLRRAARIAQWAVILTGALILAAAFAASATLRRVVAVPLARLARDARRVARGEFGHSVAIEGPRDIRGLSTDVESMRRRILAELDAVNRVREQLEEQTRDLQRSNAELEQFAYVASHDLQEPLRKVASFTGMLQHRYQGQLDERADQYIEFAVDGAKRMQGLINDLLAFSRVGRVGAKEEAVDLDAALGDVLGDLGAAIADAGARVDVEAPLPAVRGDRSLLTALLQNLVGNAIKFRGEDPPHVQVSWARRPAGGDEPDMYEFTIADNGIGIAARHAERIFVIFQRLHPKEEYTGTGIGLAMCRKIVEFHGGQIWLDAPPGAEDDAGADGDAPPGSTFHFTLPVPDEGGGAP